MTTETPDHQHEFLRTYVRTIDGDRFIIFAGELDTDEVVLMCDCGEERPLPEE